MPHGRSYTKCHYLHYTALKTGRKLFIIITEVTCKKWVRGRPFDSGALVGSAPPEHWSSDIPHLSEHRCPAVEPPLSRFDQLQGASRSRHSGILGWKSQVLSAWPSGLLILQMPHNECYTTLCYLNTVSRWIFFLLLKAVQWNKRWWLRKWTPSQSWSVTAWFSFIWSTINQIIDTVLICDCWSNRKTLNCTLFVVPEVLIRDKT